MKVKVVNKSNNALPAYETKNSAGMDLRAYLPDGPVTLQPMQRALIPTGLYIEIPEGYEEYADKLKLMLELANILRKNKEDRNLNGFYLLL